MLSRLIFPRRGLSLSSFLLALSFILWNIPVWAGAVANYALVISIDGLRPEAVLSANTLHMSSLWKDGSYTWKAQTIRPSVTLPAHTSMITGVKAEKHGMFENSWNPGMGYVKEPTIFSFLKQKGFKVAMFAGKDKLAYLAKPGTLDHSQVILSLDWGKQIALEASSYIIKEKPNFIFIHFPHPDLDGHMFGWLSEEYMEAVEKIDEAIGIVLDGLKKAGMYDKTLILITADHGGHRRGHGSSDPQDMTIPWIAHGPGVKKGYEIKKEVSICDTAATVLYNFHINFPPRLDGTAVKEIFTQKSAQHTNVKR